MQISMIGIDYNKASVDVRALFSFTKKAAKEAMRRLKEEPEILGCIILSTCNRMEIWVSTGSEKGSGDWKFDSTRLYDFLCREKNLPREDYDRYFLTRQGEEAVEHLFYLTSGLKSQILAEDQIITQVKEALRLARDEYCTDGVLEVLFRTAITAAKRVKTDVVFSRANSSVIHQALIKLQHEGYRIAGKKAMVIGNGEMGRMAAETLRDAGAEVTVTVRQYHSGVVTIPNGCEMIHYSERMTLLPWCDLVVSATASPNYTITKELYEQVDTDHGIVMIDLAVPRDVEPTVGQCRDVSLYNIDDFKVDALDSQFSQSMKKASAILREEMEEFYTWLSGRDMLPRINKIQTSVVEDMRLRILHSAKKIEMEKEEQGRLIEAVDRAAAKVVGKLLFGIRDTVGMKEFIDCIDGLERLYEEK